VGKIKKIVFFAFFLVLITFSLKSGKAGFMMVKGSVDLKPLETKEVCDAVCVFSTYTNPINCKVEASSEISKFLEPQKTFTLTENILDCPQEGDARRACIASNCSLTSDKARLVCLKFSGSFEFVLKPTLELYPEKIEYKGALKAVCQVGAATTVEPIEFWVYFYPLNIFPFILTLIVVIIIFITIFYFTKKKGVKIKVTP
jgi:hypothetical protein